MKKLLVLASLLLSNYSAHATTVVAEDTAEHTINFTFGRPTADVYLCRIAIYEPGSSNLDTMTFPDGSSINGDYMGNYGAINWYKEFTRDTSPTSSILHLGSPNYGSEVRLYFCHDLQVPGENPGGLIDTFYKIATPSSWSYFTNAQPDANVWTACYPDGFNTFNTSTSFNLVSNTATDYTLLASTPFPANEAIATDPTNPFRCYTAVFIHETATGPRPSSESAGNITVGVKDQINFN